MTNSSGGFCLDTCPTEKYVPSGTNCLDCYDTCLTCNGVSSSDCLSCEDNYFLSSGMCRYVCPSGTFPESSTKTCNACDGSCTFCFGPTIDNCTGCIDGLVLNNFTCTSSCPEELTLNQYGVCYEGWFGMCWATLVFLAWGWI